MDENDVVYPLKGMSLSHEKGGHPAICINMQEP